ncbi:MAG TPA: pyridoxal-phosphate dependent enzyme [Anaerolineales bacterium]|nr:pyridoxal-phosphate dependent enzyme [Anaerolineales bacterium]
MSTLIGIECLDCGHRAAYDPRQVECPACGGTWREARYDLKAARQALLSPADGLPGGLWRYRTLLPVREIAPGLPMGEGGSPLLPAYNLGLMLGLSRLFIKDERRGPTGSFKDRQASVTVAALREAGITEAVVASTGNVALAYAAFCARVGIQLWAFLTSLVPGAKMQEVAVYGTQVIKVTSTYDQAKTLASTFARERGYYFDRGPMSVASLESMKTLSFEIAEQIAPALGLEAPMAAPDWYVQAVSGGVGPLGVLKGFRELYEMGLIDRVPSIAVIQAEGCSPMVRAWRAGLRTAEPLVSPTTGIFTLSTGDPGRGYTMLRDRIVDGAGGTFTDVTDDEAYRAVRMLAENEGLSAEPAAGVAFAGLVKLAHEGVFQPDDVVVVNCSGHAMPVEETVLGPGWYRDLSIPARSDVEARMPPEEGLLAALSSLDRRLVRDVLIVDDDEDARVLIRRILRSHGDFHLREAASGREALAAAAEQRPDLVVLDLMMPEMDGFAVLDALKQRKETANVPVVVVTAKELTPQEKRSLEGRISRLMTKGEFMGEDLLGEIGRALD